MSSLAVHTPNLAAKSSEPMATQLADGGPIRRPRCPLQGIELAVEMSDSARLMTMTPMMTPTVIR